jgi:hypothetical protein
LVPAALFQGVESEIGIEICPNWLDLGLCAAQRSRLSIGSPELGAAGAIGRELSLLLFSLSVGS